MWENYYLSGDTLVDESNSDGDNLSELGCMTTSHIAGSRGSYKKKPGKKSSKEPIKELGKKSSKETSKVHTPPFPRLPR